LLLAASVAVLYRSVISGLMDQFYHNPDYSYGFVIPFFSAYLIWLKRDKLAQIERRPSFLGLGLLLGAIGLLYLGSIGAESFLTRISLVVIVIALVLYFQGEASVRLLAFPLALLFLMIPLPAITYNHVVFPLQLVSSGLATRILETINVVPLIREGNLLVFPHFTLEVVEACSGIRSLMSLLALALAYAYLAEPVLAIRCFLVIAMVPVAIVANGCRVVLIGLVAYYRGARTVASVMHPISSVLVFLVAVLSLLVLHGAIAALRKYRMSSETL
jgi:exosortase